jgi:Pectate lyase superfamily protein
MPTISDYLQRVQGGSALVVVNVGTWVQLVNNVTATAYVSTAATDANGQFTIATVPAGTYTVNTGPTNVGPWTATGDANYVVADQPSWLNILDFGGKADGSTDNTAALSLALTTLPSPGGTVYFPAAANAYVFASALNLTAKTAVRLQGAGPGRTGGSPTGSFIKFTGTTGPLIAATGTTSIEIADLWIFWPSAFTGTVTDLSGTTFARVTGCSYFANGGGSSAAVLIGLDNATRAVVERNVFHNATVAVQGILTGGHFSNAVAIKDNNFSSSTGDIATALIQNPGQGWLIQGNNFEMGTGAGTPTAIGQSLGGSLGVSVIGNWFGDAGAGVLTLIDINGDGWLIAGNMVGSNSNASSILINQRSGANGLCVVGNRLQNSGIGITFGGSNNDASVTGNRWNGITTRYSGSPLNGILEATTGSGGLQVFGALQRSTQTPTEAVLVSGVDATLGEHVTVTLTAARLVGAPLNPALGDHLTFTLIQGGAGAFAVTWNPVFKKTWSDAGNATGARSTISYWYDGTNWNQIGGQAPYV